MVGSGEGVVVGMGRKGVGGVGGVGCEVWCWCVSGEDGVGVRVVAFNFSLISMCVMN